MRAFFFSATLLLAGPLAAATITFDDIPAASCSGGVGTVIESGGFRFEVLTGVCTDVRPVSGDNALYSTGLNLGPATIAMESLSGDNFALSSLETWVGDVALTGYYSGGGSVQASILPGGGWTTTLLAASWQDLQQVEFVVNGELFGAIDNIVVTAVPVPAAVWLFGSALAGLGWLRRKGV